MGKKLIIKGADFSANAIAAYSVILNSNDSTLGTVSGSGDYKLNSAVTISATPIGNAQFVRWSDNNTNPVRQIVVTENINLIAYFVAVPQGYGLITFNGTENWQFNADNEPNAYGIYNCYLLNPNVVNPLLAASGFAEATCDITSLNRNIPTSEKRGNSQSMGFGYFSGDPSVFFRFNSAIASSVETFKAYLAENNITIVYRQG